MATFSQPLALVRSGLLSIVLLAGTHILSPARAQEGEADVPPLQGRLVRESFYSEVLAARVPYYVYLPPDYDYFPARRYPVLYMLHGAGGNYTEWIDSWLHTQVDDMIVRRTVQPMIVVMPDGGERSYWADWQPDGPLWSRYVVRDVIPEMDSRYRTLPRRESRAIGGHSSGGFGALHIAMRNPEIFNAVGAHSPSIRLEPEAEMWFLLGQNFDTHNPVWLARTRTEQVRQLAIWVDVGADDWWRPNIEEFRATLAALDIPFTWRLYPGTHEAEYWIFNVPNYLRFYDAHLRGDEEATPPLEPFIQANGAFPF